MTAKDINEMKALLASPQNIVIIPHKNPDGDAIGSTLALYHYFVQKGHQATVITPNEYPDFLKWVPGEQSIVKYDSQSDEATAKIKEANFIFTLDFNHFSRTGSMESLLSSLDTTFIMIDHHQQPDTYATYTYSDTSMSSTCQMVYHFIEKCGDLDYITPAIATCIYLGIMTDTGSFRFRSTTSTTHRVLADLIDKGADNTAIHEQIYDSNTMSRLRLRGVALQNLKVLPEYHTAYISLSQQELDSSQYKKGDTEGFVNMGLSLQGIKFAVIFIENKSEGIIKISFRSKGEFSVNEFSRQHFEGGGHHNAAGGRSNLSLVDTIDKFISILTQYKEALGTS